MTDASTSASLPWPPNPNARGWRRKLGEVVLSDRVQGAIIWLIVFNAIALGLETIPAVMDQYGPVLHALDTIALGIFVVEIVCKLVVLDVRFVRDGWNIFDFIIVAISLIPATGPLTVLRSLRILRVLRLINRMPQLRRIAAAIISAVPGIGAIAALMCIIFYVGAVMATMLFGQEFPEWFGDIPASLYSLFQVMTLESWSMGIVRPVMEVFPLAWVFFVPFILVSAFVMLNLFVAVMVDTMSNLTATQTGTASAPNPQAAQESDGVRPEHALFGTDSELTKVRAELAEIKQLLLAQQRNDSDN
ncbi:ion transporter [Gulosibacter bifidus]|uniref:Ion transporter n=1 Tax=Gulosibacter bifidus TaxID=272239 RepID=A0ABW5RIL3_9MICO|nr:ion transporter [Gulosibacter bifidus]